MNKITISPSNEVMQAIEQGAKEKNLDVEDFVTFIVNTWAIQHYFLKSEVINNQES